MSPLVQAVRPKQWMKNVLVFAAPAAAGVLDQARELGLTVVVFAAFCAASSGMYLWNDVLDVDADRSHPTKQHRAVASGRLSTGTARIAGVVLCAVALALAAITARWQTVAVVAVYIALTACYSFVLKHIAIVDLVAVASGFVLRAAAGAVAVDVPMSRWFVLCVTFGSLYIVVGKRYAERREMGADARTRATLDSYSVGLLMMLLAISCGAALLSYCVWAFETAAVSTSDWPLYELSIVPLLTAMFRYLLVLDQGGGGAPEDVFSSDRTLQALGAAWVVIYGLAVYAA